MASAQGTPLTSRWWATGERPTSIPFGPGRSVFEPLPKAYGIEPVDLVAWGS
jgi:hypothetical protein